MACCNYGDATMTVTLNFDPLLSDACPLMNGRCIVSKSTLDRLKSDCDDYRKQRDKAGDQLKSTLNRLTEIESSRDHHREMSKAHHSNWIEAAQARDAAQKLADSRLDTLRTAWKRCHDAETDRAELAVKLDAAEARIKQFEANFIAPICGKPWSEMWNEQRTRANAAEARIAELESDLADAEAKAASAGRAFKTFATSARQMKSVAMFSTIAAGARLDSLIECLDCAAVALERA
jgi:DNA repair exonuclease SbcCD ATPase subunit